MTFYYGDQKANRNGMDVGPFTYLGARHDVTKFNNLK